MISALRAGPSADVPYAETKEHPVPPTECGHDHQGRDVESSHDDDEPGSPTGMPKMWLMQSPCALKRPRCPGDRNVVCLAAGTACVER